MRDMNTPLTTASDIASRYTYGGAGTGILAALLQVDWAMWIGVLVAVGGFVMNLYFKIKEDRRAEQRHQQTMKQLQGQCDEKQD